MRYTRPLLNLLVTLLRIVAYFTPRDMYLYPVVLARVIPDSPPERL